MCDYFRIINKNKWPSEEEINGDINNIKAKTIVQEMAIKGDDSCLSIWKLENKKDIALALISPQKNSLEKITALKISDNLLKSNGLQIQNIEGNSVVQNLNSFHYDIINMDYKNLGDFANVIITSLKDEANLEKITKKELTIFIFEALNNDEIEFNDLSDELKKGLTSFIIQGVNTNTITFNDLHEEFKVNLIDFIGQAISKKDINFDDLHEDLKKELI